MKKIITLGLLIGLYGCNSENNEKLHSGVEQQLLLPGGAKISLEAKALKDETTDQNGKKIRKLSFKIAADDATSAEQIFYKTLQDKNYTRRVTDTGENTMRVFYSVANETGIDSYFIGSSEKKSANEKVHVILAWPTK
ncbi:MAG: Lipoprotein [Pseudomonas shahriarae]|jgi:hypothetical protein|uniref:hypothetical protein n=1 Tax=Pseudomonas TaxID=286 RepID=UPI001C68B583|nr:hypothetical protein [Pseudomonas sp. So3.2b]QYM67356.1 hypothetical protein K1X80_20390 [Pseudomonas sp. So3.2b]